RLRAHGGDARGRRVRLLGGASGGVAAGRPYGALVVRTAPVARPGAVVSVRDDRLPGRARVVGGPAAEAARGGKGIAGDAGGSRELHGGGAERDGGQAARDCPPVRGARAGGAGGGGGGGDSVGALIETASQGNWPPS